jgi:DNA-3-methyladenine glycosylase II
MSRAAVRHLKRSDPTLRALIERVGPCRLTVRTEGTHFDHLVRAIVYQQLGGRAAATIHARLLGLYGDRPPTPAELLATRPARLRRAGLSRQKLGYVRDLAGKAASGAVALADLDGSPDEAVIEALTAIKGVGPWTAQMFLMFRLGRPDVLPVLDYGIGKAIRRAYGLRRMPTAAQMERIAAPWRPHRTVACWYLWRSLDAAPP